MPVLTWPVFDALPVEAVVTTRHGGVSAGRYATLNLSFAVGDDAANVRENRRRVAAALGAPRIIRTEGPELMARLLDNAAYLRRGFRDLGLKVVEPGTLPDGSEATTPVVPVIVGEDWQAVLLWKALFEAGVYTNVVLHPAVPPGGALLRTSLMATHEREHLDRALEIIADVKGRFPDLPTQ